VEPNLEFTTLAHHILDQGCGDMTQVFLARLMEGDTYIYMDSGGVSLMSKEELALRIRNLTNQGVVNDKRSAHLGESSVGGT
jgi:hypothetical protein